MFGPPQTIVPTKLQEGMVDTHINETVTHVAELDEETIGRQFRPALIFALLACIFGFINPFSWIMACIIYFTIKIAKKKMISGTQVYLTEHTLVCTFGNQPIASSRLTIPLANIASATVQSGVLTVNIKPTAPEVMLNSNYARYGNATRTVPIYYVKNAELFAEVIQSNLH